MVRYARECVIAIIRGALQASNSLLFLAALIAPQVCIDKPSKIRGSLRIVVGGECLPISQLRAVAIPSWMPSAVLSPPFLEVVS